jgi:hypothetical protein
MENESIGKRGMGINYKGSQGQTKRAVALQEEEEKCTLVQALGSLQALRPIGE